MNIFQNIGKAFEKAADYVSDKNRKAAYVNRIRTVIRCEEKAAEREYLALGRYFYNNLRNTDNPVTEAHCAELDAIEGRLDKALNQLEQYYTAEQEARSSKSEEIDIDDVESFDEDPLIDIEVTVEKGEKEPGAPVVEIEPLEEPEEPQEAPAEEEAAAESAEPEENGNLPFE